MRRVKQTASIEACRQRMLRRRESRGPQPFLSEEKLSRIQKHLINSLADEADPEKRGTIHSRLKYVTQELYNLREGRDPLVDPRTEKQCEFSRHFME